MRTVITGGVAEGKSTVLKMLHHLGASVLSSDDVARELMEDSAIQLKISRVLGISLPIDRAELRKVLVDHTQRKLLNNIMHPHVLRKLQESKAQFVEVPLLFETALAGPFNRIWIVTCGRQEQLSRLTARLGDSLAAEALISTQIASRAKIPFADVVIRTNVPMPDVQRLVSAAVAL